MRVITEFFRWFTGLLFIFSGLIKVNDPVGTSIKLTEYFEVFSLDIAPFFRSFIPYSLYLSVFLCVVEVVLGLALLIRYKPKVTTSLLLVMILFFTFLTFYSAYFNKVTDCGCFGDAIKLTPWESFYKDLILLFTISWLFFARHRAVRPENQATRHLAIILTTLLNLAIAYYAIAHLPFIDFRAFKVGTHIPTNMQPSEEFQYQYIMSKNGEEVVFDEYPTDESYEFKEMILKNPEAKPKITEYNIWNDEGDWTDYTLQGNKLIVIISNTEKANARSFRAINILIDELNDTDIEAIAITSSERQLFENFRHEVQLAIPYYYGDATVLKTIIRSNPGLIFLQNGEVKAKYHYNDVPSVEEIKELYAR